MLRPMQPLNCFNLLGISVYSFSSTARARLRRAIVFLGSILLSGAPLTAAELRAGLAKIDITPREPVMLAGYESRKDLCKGIHDPLFARALVFEQNGARLALISIENLGFYNDTAEPLRQGVIEACGLKPAELFLCAIHTHSAPTLTLDASRAHTNNVEYTRTLRRQLVEVTRTAIENLQPVSVGYGSGSSPVGVNRREPTTDKNGMHKIILGRNPSVLTDREVQVLKLIRPGQNTLAGVLFDYQTHSTSLGPANYLVSGDIHGLAAQFLEGYFGENVVVPEFAGASGNIDPWVRVLPDFRTNNGWIPEPVLLGTMLGEEVARVTERTFPNQNPAGIRAQIKVLQLPAKPKSLTNAVENTSGTVTAPITLTVARLGEIAFVGWGGEVFNEIGQAVKKESPFPHTFVFTHCNGAAGYMPIRSAYPEGGYEVQSSQFAAGAAEQLAKETLSMLREVQ
jgi:neutral ceramidase